MYDKVFISYAKENIEVAERIYYMLQTKGYIPWLDKYNLKVGQQWDVEIKRALKEADFIIILLSSISVAKRGYVQREFRLVLNYCEEKLDSDIYIIPIKLDACDVPDRLARFQYIEWEDPDVVEQAIQKALSFQRQRLINAHQLSIYRGNLQYKEVDIIETIGDKKPQSKINIIYPQFCNIYNNADLKILNSYIESYILKIYNQFIQLPYKGILADTRPYLDNIESLEPEERFLYKDNEVQINYSMDFLTEKIISFRYVVDTYYSGAPHHYHYSKGCTYVFSPLSCIKIEQLFDNREDGILFLYDKCLNDFTQRNICILNDLYKKEWNVFENFYLDQDALYILFNPYKIASFIEGEIIVRIPFEEISCHVPQLRTLEKIITAMK